MKILVTGGAGFIGSHITDQLVNMEHQVTVLDNLSAGLLENVNKSARFIAMDVRSSELAKWFKEEQFDYVIHQAAQTSVADSLKCPDYDCQVNVAGTVNILEACRQSGVKRLVFASSAAVYGDVAIVPVEENHSLQPTSFYGLSKLTCENYLRLYGEIYGMSYVILRYANVYGERQGESGEGGVISIFAKRIAAGLPVVIFGDGTQTRDFIYVKDVAQANIQALVTECDKAAYNIGTKTESTVNMLVDHLTKIAGKRTTKVHEAFRKGDIYRSALENTLAVRHLAWRPETVLADGLEQTYRFVCGRKDQLLS